MTKILIDKATVNLARDALEVATTPFARDRQEVLRAQTALKALDPFANVGKGIEQPATTENNGGKTGWFPGLLQDECKGLSKRLSNQPDAKRRVREALAEQPAQHVPVAWMYQCSADNSGPVLMQHKQDWAKSGSGLWTEAPLYTSPPARSEWVGLTQEQIENCYGGEIDDFARAIEAKSKELNT